MSTVRKLISLVVSVLILVALKFIYWNSSVKDVSSPDLPIVAITQIVEHPALDQEREGIIKALGDAGFIDGKNIKIVYQNAQGAVATASQIVTQLLSQKPRVMVAISTPSAQAAYALCLQNKVPLVFSAVTDPVSARLCKDIQTPDQNVTGVSDRLAPEKQIALIKQFLPNIKTLGVIYNAGEANSVAMATQLKVIASAEQIAVVDATVNKTSDIPSATASLVGRVEAIYVPNDNTAVSAMSSIVQLAEKHQLPVFAGDLGSVMNGAIATEGYDRVKLGQKAGEKVVAILNGTPVSQIPISVDHDTSIWLNQVAAARFGVTIPAALHITAQLVGDNR